jgi:glutaredoxin
MDFAAAKAYDHLKRQLLQDLNEAYRTVDLNDDRHGELDSDPSVVVHDNKTTTTLENQQGCNIEDGIQLNLINMRMHSQYDVKSMYPSAPSQNAF